MRIINLLLISLILFGCGGNDDSSSAVSPPPAVTTPPPISGNDSLCNNPSNQINWDALMNEDCPQLADYQLFSQADHPTTAPNTPGIKYELSTQLFSNYANKYRFIFLPEGKTISFNEFDTFGLPVGTVLTKTFALPFDTQVSGSENEVMIETRLLIHREAGWTTLAYLWENGQATLIQAGANVSHTLNRQGEQLSFNYHVPSRAECKLCHQVTSGTDNHISPIGLKSHLLNHKIEYQGVTINQLALWQQKGWLDRLPAANELSSAPAIDDGAASLTNRAKGYLDINCAHCHRAEGFASLSGLRLGYNVDHTSFQYGICKQPPGWDGGEKGLSYDIIPGDAEHSILLYRQELNNAKDRMPPIGRSLVHREAVTIIRKWIDTMAPSIGTCQH
ncbi:SO2930 family diheme c-type cytochrome [Shewanella colwelliana]|uniref:Cytochrome c domain-containing protein n=2 Tax=Shewanella colwelliana TaxID=23 RepID=A0A1E5IXP5_SHECO|nr:SO2930 family diheme c-type cytochrome [Shewanella colwelliana]MDX1282135.1 SO2930 family diheme c-type cytochrome [Shewanella colwelliana]OEG75320.1 hypothetical protein BEL05_08910 [Shewanella colwelliana]